MLVHSDHLYNRKCNSLTETPTSLQLRETTQYKSQIVWYIEMIHYDMTYYDMTYHDITYYGMAYYDMTYHDMTYYDMP